MSATLAQPSILDRLSLFASQTASKDKTAWAYLDDKCAVVDSYTYKELDYVTSFLAVHFVQELGLQPGQRALLVFFPGLAFTVSLLACFKAGIIAVPVFPPDPRKLKKDLRHFISTQGSSGANVALTNDDYNFAKNVADIKRLLTLEDGWPDIKWLSIDSAIKSARKNYVAGKTLLASHAPPLEPENIAFLQYTSGSTSEPKGVMISNRSLSHNLTLIIRELKADETTINVSWLPQYHDMGLIGSYMGIIYSGGTGYYLSPISFLKEPLSWIRAMSKFRGTHTQAPNFAYALVVRKFRENYGDEGKIDPTLFDLSSLRHMINAAEPIDVESLRDFYTLFRKFKLPQGVVFPTYGLAEHTVFVCSGGDHIIQVTKASIEASGKVEIITEDSIDNLTSISAAAAASVEVISNSDNNNNNNNKKDNNQHTCQWIVGCGYPGRGENVDVRIVANRESSSPEGEVSSSSAILAEDHVGEVWVTSPSKASGYWGLPDLSRDDFHAKISANTLSSSPSSSNAEGGGEIEYLRTGDLGFLHRGELFICGRLKDLIIVRGSNHYPQDIERTAEKCTNFLRAGCSAAFSIKPTGNSTESIVLVAELKDNVKTSRYNEIVESCRTVVASEHGLSLTHILLLKTRSIPKTTSGKIARAWCRRAFLENTLQAVHRWSTNTAAANNSNNNNTNNNNSNNTTATTSASGGSAISSTQPTPNADKTATFAAGGGGDDFTDYDNINSNNNNSMNPDSALMMPNHSLAELRNTMTMAEIEESVATAVRLLTDSGQGGMQLTEADRAVSLASLGIDSLTMVQLKGALEKRYFCELPDEFFFQSFCSVKQIAQAVRHGGVTESQAALLLRATQASQLDAAKQEGGGIGREAGGAIGEEQVQYKQPLCPWFLWCC